MLSILKCNNYVLAIGLLQAFRQTKLAQQNILHGSEYKKINEKHIITTGAPGTDHPPFFF
jgi:hypothetical protein